jgi:hypothetical protein
MLSGMVTNSLEVEGKDLWKGSNKQVEAILWSAEDTGTAVDGRASIRRSIKAADGRQHTR